jgi:hypothetical protein
MQLLQEMNLRAIVAGLSEINLGLIQYFPGFNFFYGLDITFQYFILKRDPHMAAEFFNFAAIFRRNCKK